MDITKKEKGFDTLESIVWKFDKNWEGHIPSAWTTSCDVKVPYGEGCTSCIVKVFNENLDEIGAVLELTTGDVPELGYMSEPFENFADAFYALALMVVEEEKLRRQLAD